MQVVGGRYIKDTEWVVKGKHASAYFNDEKDIIIRFDQVREEWQFIRGAGSQMDQGTVL